MVNRKLQLVIDKGENRVLFAEAHKDFVDFIFHVLSLPLGTVTRILCESGDSGMTVPGCLGSLYEGIKVLDDDCFYSTVKERLLKSKPPSFCFATFELLPEASLPRTRVFRQCSRNTVSVCSLDNNERHDGRCRSCSQILSGRRQVYFHGEPSDVEAVNGSDGSGYVKQQVVFIVTDDLVVKPMSGLSVISVMGPKDQVSNFEEKEVDFGREEALKLLKASLQSKTVLTDVFLNGLVGKGALKRERRG